MENLSYGLSIFASIASLVSIIWVGNLSKKINISQKQDRRIKNKGNENINNSGDNNHF